MKCVVTGVNEHGRSHVVSVRDFDPSQTHVVWDYEPSHVLHWIHAIDPKAAADWIGPATTGGVRWMFVSLPPDAEAEHQKHPGIDKDGFHTTRTVDFDFIFDGELTLVVDEGRVPLHKGDFVIQQATRHAWKNESNKPALMLALIHRPNGV